MWVRRPWIPYGLYDAIIQLTMLAIRNQWPVHIDKSSPFQKPIIILTYMSNKQVAPFLSEFHPNTHIEVIMTFTNIKWKLLHPLRILHNTWYCYCIFIEPEYWVPYKQGQLLLSAVNQLQVSVSQVHNHHQLKNGQWTPDLHYQVKHQLTLQKSYNKIITLATRHRHRRVTAIIQQFLSVCPSVTTFLC